MGYYHFQGNNQETYHMMNTKVTDPLRAFRSSYMFTLQVFIANHKELQQEKRRTSLLLASTESCNKSLFFLFYCIASLPLCDAFSLYRSAFQAIYRSLHFL